MAQEDFDRIDELHYAAENKLWALVKSLQAKREAGDWIDTVSAAENTQGSSP